MKLFKYFVVVLLSFSFAGCDVMVRDNRPFHRRQSEIIVRQPVVVVRRDAPQRHDDHHDDHRDERNY